MSGPLRMGAFCPGPGQANAYNLEAGCLASRASVHWVLALFSRSVVFKLTMCKELKRWGKAPGLSYQTGYVQSWLPEDNTAEESFDLSSQPLVLGPPKLFSP